MKQMIVHFDISNYDGNIYGRPSVNKILGTMKDELHAEVIDDM